MDGLVVRILTNATLLELSQGHSVLVKVLF